MFITSADAAPRSRWTTSEATRIHFLDTGPARTSKAIVLIHGWTCNADFWKTSIDAFPGYRVLAVDLPGHGKSDKPHVEYTMDRFARAVDAVMRQAGVRQAVLVGHSMGTPVGRQFYRLYPKKTIALVVVDGALVLTGSMEPMRQLVAAMKKDYRAATPGFVDAMLTPVKSDEHKRMIRASMLATPEHVAVSAMEAMLDDRIWTSDKVNVPVLAVMAPGFWQANSKEMFAAMAPDMEWHMWQDVSHFLMMDKPAEFNAAVAGFIKRKKLL